MDLYQIRYFLVIVETGSFTKAAERLFVSQPSLSAGIKKLEQELGVTLLERRGRRTALTPEGRFFLERAQAILREYDNALHGLRDFRSQPTLRLGTPRTIPVASLSKVMAAFQAQYPHVVLELRDGLPQDLLEALEQGELDLIITAANGSHSPSRSQVLFQQPLQVAVPLDHPLAQRQSVRLIDLDQQPYIHRTPCEVWREHPQLFESAGVHPRVVYRADHEEWVIALISAGLGISIMPVWKSVHEVVYLPISDHPLCRTVSLKWRSHQTSDLVDQLRAFLSSHDW